MTLVKKRLERGAPPEEIRENEVMVFCFHRDDTMSIMPLRYSTNSGYAVVLVRKNLEQAAKAMGSRYAKRAYNKYGYHVVPGEMD